MASDATIPPGSSGRRDQPETRSESAPSGAAEGEKASLPLDQVFEILRNQRRRYVLEILRNAEEPLLIGDLAERIAAWENDKQPHDITSSERKRVYVGLYQAHLPKMDGMDIVSFNKPRGVIEPDVNICAFDEYLAQDVAGRTRPWHAYYAGLSVLSVGVLIAAFALRSMVTLPVVEIAVVLAVTAFSLCSMGHLYWKRRSDGSTSEQD